MNKKLKGTMKNTTRAMIPQLRGQGLNAKLQKWIHFRFSRKDGGLVQMNTFESSDGYTEESFKPGIAAI